MKTVSKLSLFAITLLVVGCNEKVSPELMSGNAEVPGGVAVPPSEYYFNVKNESSALLNYNLHKTGSGNQTTSCEVKNTTGLSNEIFRGNQAANDITCFFDAEELSLQHGGMSFSLNSSPNTCDYVGYSPFSYYNKIPGDSTSQYLEIDCTSDTTNNTHVVTAAGSMGQSLVANNGTLGCGDIASKNIADGDRIKFQLAEDAELCRFNYEDSDGGENCDIGTVSVDTLSVTFTTDENSPPGILKYELKNRKIDCGGKVEACIKGPITQITKSATRVTEIYNTELNKVFKKTHELPSLIEGEVDEPTLGYANFRRNLASTQIDYISSTDVNYTSAFSNSMIGKSFNPNLIEAYSANKKLDGTKLITPLIHDQFSYPENKYKAVPLASDPFMGLSGRTNPFYTFYCFDTAFDVKARIRMVVRDWDRVSPGAQYSDYLSDIWRGVDARQDNPTEVEISGEDDGYFVFNDVPDWDDVIPMIRTSGGFNSSLTIWQPLPDGTYTYGWFNPLIFPRIE